MAAHCLFLGLIMKLELFHVDTCLSDFWAGHSLPHVQIEVWPGMSMKNIKDALRDELRMGCVMGSDDNARLLSDAFVGAENEKRADQLTRAAYAAINRMRPINKGQRRFFTDLEPIDSEDDTIESVYAFFIFDEVSRGSL